MFGHKKKKSMGTPANVSYSTSSSSSTSSTSAVTPVIYTTSIVPCVLPEVGRCEICGEKVYGQIYECQLCGKKTCGEHIRVITRLSHFYVTSSTFVVYTVSPTPVNPIAQDDIYICTSCADILKLSLRVAAKNGENKNDQPEK